MMVENFHSRGILHRCMEAWKIKRKMSHGILYFNILTHTIRDRRFPNLECLENIFRNIQVIIYNRTKTIHLADLRGNIMCVKTTFRSSAKRESSAPANEISQYILATKLFFSNCFENKSVYVF